MSTKNYMIEGMRIIFNYVTLPIEILDRHINTKDEKSVRKDYDNNMSKIKKIGIFQNTYYSMTDKIFEWIYLSKHVIIKNNKILFNHLLVIRHFLNVFSKNIWRINDLNRKFSSIKEENKMSAKYAGEYELEEKINENDSKIDGWSTFDKKIINSIIQGKDKGDIKNMLLSQGWPLKFVEGHYDELHKCFEQEAFALVNKDLSGKKLEHLERYLDRELKKLDR